MVNPKDLKSLNAHAPGILEALVKAESPESTEVISNWSDRLLVDLPAPCRIWLATGFTGLGVEERAAVVAGLAPARHQDGLGSEEGERYRAFMQAVAEEGRQTAEIREHLEEVADTAVKTTVVQSQGQNPQATNAAKETAQAYLPEIMPVLATSLRSLPSSKVAGLLNRVFSEALYINSSPQLLGTLHSAMVGRWPNPEDVDYEAQSIFERARQALETHPALEEAPTLLRSISSLEEVAGLESEYTAQVLDAACALWPEHPAPAADVITSYDVAPTAECLVSLATAAKEDTEQQSLRRERLREIWRHCAPRIDVDSQLETTVGLLGISRIGVEGDPDWALGTWLELLPDVSAVLKAAFVDDRLADDDLERLWRRAGGLASRLGAEFFREVLPLIAARSDIEKTLSAMRGSRTKITSLYEGQEQRNELGRGLLEAMVGCSSNDGKGMFAQWMDEAKAGYVLGYLNELHPSEVDLDILNRQFPNSSRLQEYRRSHS